MSEPRKHHYVPQVHINKFKSIDGFFVYFKADGKVINKKSSTDVFETKDLNSTLDENGQIEHKSMETKLAKKWDDNFNYHHDAIIDWICDSIDSNTCSNIDIQNSLRFFFEYALVGFMRGKKRDKKFNEYMVNELLEYSEFADEIEAFDFSESNLSEFQISEGRKAFRYFSELITNYISERKKKLKFPLPIAEEMDYFMPDKFVCDVIIAREGSFFLPDTTSIIEASDMKRKYLDFEINQIKYVGIPINSKVFLQIKNHELFPDSSSDIYSFSKERVDEINQRIIKFSSDYVLINSDYVRSGIKYS